MWRSCRTCLSASRPRLEALRALNTALGLPADKQWNHWHLLAPIFSSDFTFEQDHLSALGETLISSTLADALQDYCFQTGQLLTPNGGEEVVAVMLNHYTLRMIADQLGLLQYAAVAFRERASQRQRDLWKSEGKDEEGEEKESEDMERVKLLKGLLEAPQGGPRVVDTFGTSFDLNPHKFGRSELSTHVTHLLGALQIEAGEDIARGTVRRLWQIEGDDVKVPYAAAKLLANTCAKYPTSSVVHSILASQGIRVKFKTRSILYDPVGDPQSAESFVSGEGSSRSAAEEDELKDEEKKGVAVTRQQTSNGMRDNNTGSGGVTNTMATSAAPQSFEEERHQRAVEMWKQRSEAPATVGSSGWLEPEGDDKNSNKSAAPNVDIPSNWFADAIGVPHPPTFGGYTAPRPFSTPPGDQSKTIYGKEGLEINTGGLSTPEYIECLSKPHQRLFEVRMEKVKERNARYTVEKDVCISRAIADRYTTARVMACRAFVGRVFNDLQRLSESKFEQ